MQGKIVLFSVLILSLVTAQTQVEAGCCQMAVFPPTGIICKDLSPDVCKITPGCRPSIGNICPLGGNSAQIQVEAKELCCPTTFTAKCNKLYTPGTCAKTPGCHILVTDKDKCPLLGNSGVINEYCKLGCAFSVCNAISTLQISGEEVVNEAVGQCNNACSAFCAKGSTLEIA